MTMIYVKRAGFEGRKPDYEYWVNVDHITHIGSKIGSTNGCLIYVVNTNPIDTDESIDDIMNKIRNAS